MKLILKDDSGLEVELLEIEIDDIHTEHEQNMIMESIISGIQDIEWKLSQMVSEALKTQVMKMGPSLLEE